MLFAFLGALGFTDLTATLNCIPSGEARAAFSRALQEHVRPQAGGARAGGRPAARREPACGSSTRRIPEVTRILAERALDARLPGRGVAAPPRRAQGAPRRGGVRFSESAAIVRGLDYYTRTVFEVASERLGAQNAILGGGRYDGLVAELGGPPTPAVGFAIGEDRLVAAMTADVAARARPLLGGAGLEGRVSLRPRRLLASCARRCPRPSSRRDLTGRGIVRGLARAAHVLAEPSRVSLPRRAPSARCSWDHANERTDTVTIKDLSSGEQQTFPRAELRRAPRRREGTMTPAAAAGGRAARRRRGPHGAAEGLGRAPPRPRRADLPVDPGPQRPRPGRLRPGALSGRGRGRGGRRRGARTWSRSRARSSCAARASATGSFRPARSRSSPRASRSWRAPRRRPSSSRTARTRPRSFGSSTVTSTCGGRRC